MDPTFTPPVTTDQPLPTQTRKPTSWFKKRMPWIVSALVVIVGVGVSVYYFLALTPVEENEIAAAKVVIEPGTFTPGTILVKKGSDVTWTNTDEQPHKILADDANLGLDSGEALSNGDSYTFTFENAGTYSYYDPLQASGFKGVVVVE